MLHQVSRWQRLRFGVRLARPKTLVFAIVALDSSLADRASQSVLHRKRQGGLALHRRDEVVGDALRTST